jgi:hypothetical protein
MTVDSLSRFLIILLNSRSHGKTRFVAPNPHVSSLEKVAYHDDLLQLQLIQDLFQHLEIDPQWKKVH